MGEVIKPPRYFQLDAPVIFLAGPIQGADNWQSRAIELISSEAPELFIASPRREIRSKGEFAVDMYNEQVDWETHHLRTAGDNGVVLFWLAKENEHVCRRAYAQTSRFELAEWKMRHERDGAYLAIGMEKGFSGGKYLIRRMAQDCPEVPIHSSLEDTCGEAISLARKLIV